MVRAALRLASMTHADALSSQACAVWCLAIRAALRVDDPSDTESLAVAVDRDVEMYLPEDADYWRDVLAESFGTSPVDYFAFRPGNGYCVTTLRAAWAAVTGTPVPDDRPGLHLRLASEAAVRGGGDTDTVACVAGALLGALWGYSAVPLQWRRPPIGWPGLRGCATSCAWPTPSTAGACTPATGRTPSTSTTRGGAAPGRSPCTRTTTASCCRASTRPTATDRSRGHRSRPSSRCAGSGSDDLDHLGLAPQDRVEVRLVDSSDAGENPHLQLVMDDAADAVAAFRAEGKRVLLHCVRRSRARRPSPRGTRCGTSGCRRRRPCARCAPRCRLRRRTRCSPPLSHLSETHDQSRIDSTGATSPGGTGMPWN